MCHHGSGLFIIIIIIYISLQPFISVLLWTWKGCYHDNGIPLSSIISHMRWPLTFSGYSGHLRLPSWYPAIKIVTVNPMIVINCWVSIRIPLSGETAAVPPFMVAPTVFIIPTHDRSYKMSWAVFYFPQTYDTIIYGLFSHPIQSWPFLFPWERSFCFHFMCYGFYLLNISIFIIEVIVLDVP